MTVMAPEDQARPAHAAIRRPASGFEIDPGKLIRWRAKRSWSRDDLALRIKNLDLHDEVTGQPYTVTRDAIAKIENGGRNPKPRTLRALCLGLSLADDPCVPEDLLMPEPEEGLEPGDEADAGQADYAGIREFAEANDIPWHRNGRVHFSKSLRDAYALAEAGAPEADIAEAITAAKTTARVAEAVARIVHGEPRKPGRPADREAPARCPGGKTLIDVLDLSAPAHNALISAGINTIGQLEQHSPQDLSDKGVRPKAVREIGAAMVRNGRELAGDAAA